MQREIESLLQNAQYIFQQHFPPTVYFERSLFTNWTCAIADCKYCYLSTKPKYDPRQGTTALRSQESILAEVLLCKLLGWKVGYITGGLRVESADYLLSLLQNIEKVYGEKIMMNYGPYSRPMIQKLKPYVKGMGCAIESFDEELHNCICPSKPLKSLLTFLEDLQQEGMQKLITIILGFGEKKEEVYTVIENIRRYNIEYIQLCFLKAQENTVFDMVPPPNMEYMAWWVAQIRIACPQANIKVALVPERINDFSLLLQAGANSFSRFTIFHDFAGDLALQLEQECAKAGRTLVGHFTELPWLDLEKEVRALDIAPEMKEKVLLKGRQYYNRLGKLTLGELPIQTPAVSPAHLPSVSAKAHNP